MDKQYVAYYKCRLCGQEYKIDTIFQFGWFNVIKDIKKLICGNVGLPNMKAIHDCTGKKEMFGVADFIGYQQVKG